MKKILVVYNPRSSQFGRVKEEVLNKLPGLEGWMVGKFEVADTNVDDNAGRLAKLVEAGDLVVAVGGDGTATIALNGVLLSGARGVVFGVLGYGNFNDTVRNFGTTSLEEILAVVQGGGEGKVMEAWALECLVNGEHWRWGMSYFTVGLFAEACKVFDEKDNRRKLRSGKKSVVYSLGLLVKWYFKNRKRQFMGDFELRKNGSAERKEGMTDYVAVNGVSMARMMKGGTWFLDEKKFLSETRNLRGLASMVSLMVQSILRRVPGEESSGDVLVFDAPASLMIQAEGEYKKLEEVNKLEVRKAKRSVKVVVSREL